MLNQCSYFCKFIGTILSGLNNYILNNIFFFSDFCLCEEGSKVFSVQWQECYKHVSVQLIYPYSRDSDSL